MDGVKTCTKCKEVKALSEFRDRHRDGKVYKRSWCKACDNAYGRAYTASGKRIEVPIYARHHMSKEQYETMLERQNNQCANPYCDGPAEKIDHDHKCCPGKRSCGKCVRGLLCHGCNAAEGLLRSDYERMMGLAEYTLKFKDVLGNVD